MRPITHLFHHYNICSISIIAHWKSHLLLSLYWMWMKLGVWVQDLVQDVSAEIHQDCSKTTWVMAYFFLSPALCKDFLTDGGHVFWPILLIYSRIVYISPTMLYTKSLLWSKMLFCRALELDMCAKFQANRTHGLRGVAFPKLHFWPLITAPPCGQFLGSICTSFPVIGPSFMFLAHSSSQELGLEP